MIVRVSVVLRRTVEELVLVVVLVKNTLKDKNTRTTTTLTLLDETFTDLPKPTQRTGTRHLLLQ